MKRALSILALVILTFFPGLKLCGAADSAQVVAAVVFDYPAEVPAEVREFVPIRPGEPFSSRKVRDSIKLLWLKGLFQDIVVEGNETPSGLVVTYHLIPRLRIDKIKVEGNDEVSKKKIIGRLLLKERDFLVKGLIEKSKVEIKNLYEEEGFRKASVDIAIDSKNPLKAIVTVIVDEGPPTTINKITFSGDTGLKEPELRKKIKIKEGRPASKEKINNSVESLTDYLIKKDFVAANVEPEVSFLDDKADIDFKINAGPKLSVEYEGNESISSRKLNKQLTFWEDRDISEETISENLDKLINYYKKIGYFFATADSRTEESKEPPAIVVKFVVDEGPRVKLDKIILEGNREIKTSDIKGVMELTESGIFRKTRVTTEAVEQDAERIKAYYETKGFLRAEVNAREPEFSPDRQKAALVFDINEGPRTYVASIDVKGNEQVDHETLLQSAVKEKTGEPFSPQQAKDDENSIISLYSQRGYIYAAVETENIFSEDNTKVNLTFNVKEGIPVKAGRIILSGNEDTRDRVLLRELLLKTGDPLDYEKILKSQQRIYKLGFFSQVKIQPVEPEKVEPVKDLLVTVKERNAGAVEVGAGYGDFERYRGFAEVSYKNLFGLGHRVSARGEMSTKGGKALLAYRWPWFLGYEVDFRTSLVYLDLEKPSYHIIDLIANTGFDKSFGQHITASLAYQYEKVKNSAREDAVLAPEDRRKTSLASISPSAIFDYRDNPFNATKGSVYAVIFKFASKYIGSTVDMLKLSAQGSWYVPVYKKIIFGFSARGGIAGWPSGHFNVPISERFFLGGAYTLRGYAFETVAPRSNGTPAGGDSMALFNTEVRFPLPYGFGLVTFLDAGNVWLLNKNFSTGEQFEWSGTNGLRYGAGVGLRYDTPVGPLRLDYGIKLNPLPGESKGVLHFTVGQAF